MEVVDMSRVRNAAGRFDSIDLPVDKIIQEYRSGVSENALSKIYGVSRSVIRKRLIDNGVMRRNQSMSETVKWARMTPAQRRHQTRAAHDAATGRKRSVNERIEGALSRERIGKLRWRFEPVVYDALLQQGEMIIKQMAIGTYNCDFGLPNSHIIVEVFGGNWHLYGKKRAANERRIKYFLDCGWSVLCIIFSGNREFIAKEFITSLDMLRSNPSNPRQYRVIWCNGDLFTTGSINDDQISLINPFTNRRNPINGRYERIRK